MTLSVINSKIEKAEKSSGRAIGSTQLLAVSKVQPNERVLSVLKQGHIIFGENKVQEAIDKWSDIKVKTNIKLHLIGRLQTNKVKFALRIFDYIHSLDSEKLATKIADEQVKQGKKPKIFIQVNIGNEEQKTGINKEKLSGFYKFCKNLNLDVIGTMCIPPNDSNTEEYFSEMKDINQALNFKDLSMGMSSDYMDAVKNRATYIRVGSKIFGSRT